MSLERQCTRCCDSLLRLSHALLDSPAQPRALWLLTRVADFLLKVRTGEWDKYHPLRQRVYFRQLAAEIAAAVNGELGGTIPLALSAECDTSILEFLKGLQAVRHFPEKPDRAAGVAVETSRGAAPRAGASADVNRM
jgi:hypothetical protein